MDYTEDSLKDSEEDSIRRKLNSYGNICTSRATKAKKGKKEKPIEARPMSISTRVRDYGQSVNSVQVTSFESAENVPPDDSENTHDQEDWSPSADPLRILVFYSIVIFFMASFLLGIGLSLLYYSMGLHCHPFAAFLALEVGSWVLCLLFAIFVAICYIRITGKERQSQAKVAMGLFVFVSEFILWIWFYITFFDRNSALGPFILILQLINQIILALIMWHVGLDPLCIYNKVSFTESRIYLCLAVAKESTDNPKKRLKGQYITFTVLLMIVFLFDGTTFPILYSMDPAGQTYSIVLYTITFIIDLISIGYVAYCFKKHMTAGYYIGFRTIFIIQCVHCIERFFHVGFVSQIILYVGNGKMLLNTICPHKEDGIPTSPICLAIVCGILSMTCCMLMITDGIKNLKKYKKEQYFKQNSTSKIVSETI